jgi:hypothetical protein
MTDLFLYNTTTNGLGFRDIGLGTRGDGVQSDTTNTANGPQDILVATWITPQLAAVSIGANSVTVNVWGQESNMNANAGFKVVCYRTNSSGVNQSTIFTTTMSSELTTPNVVRNWTVTATSTNISAGERIKVEVRITDVGGTMATGYTVTEYYDGTTVDISGDTYIRFAETIALPSATLSGSKSAYLKGRNDATPGTKSAYAKGAATLSGNKSAYALGVVVVTGNKGAYLKGAASDSSNKGAYAQGKIEASGSKSSYMNGTGIGTNVNDSNPAYIEGITIASGSKNAFLLGIGSLLVPDGVAGSTGTWRNELDSDTNLWQSVDETTASDSDYVWNTDPTNAQYIEFSLTNPSGTPGDGDVVVLWRGVDWSGLGAETCTVQLRQGTSTVIASGAMALSSAIKGGYFQLTAGEKSNITDWNDLRIRITVTI